MPLTLLTSAACHGGFWPKSHRSAGEQEEKGGKEGGGTQTQQRHGNGSASAGTSLPVMSGHLPRGIPAVGVSWYHHIHQKGSPRACEDQRLCSPPLIYIRQIARLYLLAC